MQTIGKFVNAAAAGTVNAANSAVTMEDFLLYTLASLGLGLIIAITFRFKNKSSKGFSITLAILPAIVQMVIMLVNGNIGTGVAVMGAFSLVRFRSAPGSARDICSIFLAMAAGLATGTGYIRIAYVFVCIICLMDIVYAALPFGNDMGKKQLIVTIPESLDYAEVFDDLFEKYTSYNELVNVKTTNMGSLFKLTYEIRLREKVSEKEFLNELRCRNGNLEISCGRPVSVPYEQL